MSSIFFTDAELAEMRAKPARCDWAAELVERLRATVDRDPQQPTYEYETIWPYAEDRQLARKARDIALLHAVVGDQAHLREMTELFRKVFRLDAMEERLDETPPLHVARGNAPHAKHWRLEQWSYGLARGMCFYAYDLTRDHPIWQEDDYGKRVETRFGEVLATQKPILAQGRKTSNTSSWFMATCAILGALLGDDEAVELAIEAPLGFKSMLGHLSDGRFWPEPLSYGHQYVKDTLTIVAEIARHTGREDLYRWETDEGVSLKSMYDGFLEMLFADGRLAVHGDGGGAPEPRTHVPERERLYQWWKPAIRLWGWPRNRDGNTFEIAYRAYRDPRHAWVLAQSPKRDTWDHEFWGYTGLSHGVAELGETEPPDAHSRVWRCYGAALVRGDESADYWENGAPAVYLRKGQQQAHGHDDLANILLNADGRNHYPDLMMRWNYQGRKDPNTGKNLDPTPYSKRRIAHNTVSIDCGHTRLPFVSEIGAVWRTGPMKAVTLMDGDGPLRRVIGVTPQYVLDWACVGPVGGPDRRPEHIFDYHLHGLGLPELFGVGELTPYTTLNEEYGLGPIDAGSDAPDNQWIRPGHSATTDDSWRAVMREETPLDPDDPRGMLVHGVAEPGTQLITGDTPDYVGMEGWDATQPDGGRPGRLGMFVARRRAPATDFLIVHQPFRGTDPQPLTVQRAGEDELEVRGPGFIDRIALTTLRCERDAAS